MILPPPPSKLRPIPSKPSATCSIPTTIETFEASEVRQAVQTGVQALFTVADTNQDGQLTPYELNAAVGEAAKSAVQTVFQAADTDRNGSLTMAEYDKALTEPAHALFRVIDADNNDELSLAELQRAEQILADQIYAPPRAGAGQLAVRIRPKRDVAGSHKIRRFRPPEPRRLIPATLLADLAIARLPADIR